MSLEHLVIPEGKEMLKERWGHVTGQEANLNGVPLILLMLGRMWHDRTSSRVSWTSVVPAPCGRTECQWPSVRKDVFDLTGFAVFTGPLKRPAMNSNTGKNKWLQPTPPAVSLRTTECKSFRCQIWTLTFILISVIGPALKWPAF